MLGSPRTQHLWSLNWEKVSGSTLALWVRLQRLQFLFIVLGGKLIANSNSGVMLMLFVLSWKTWNIVQPGAWLAKPPLGSQQSQDYLISGAAKSCIHIRQSLTVTVRAVSWQVRSKVRSLFALSLKPKEDSLFNSPNIFPWDFPDKNTRVDCHFLLQGLFPAQGLNLCLLHCRRILYSWATREACMQRLDKLC